MATDVCLEKDSPHCAVLICHGMAYLTIKWCPIKLRVIDKNESAFLDPILLQVLKEGESKGSSNFDERHSQFDRTTRQ